MADYSDLPELPESFPPRLTLHVLRSVLYHPDVGERYFNDDSFVVLRWLQQKSLVNYDFCDELYRVSADGKRYIEMLQVQIALSSGS